MPRVESSPFCEQHQERPPIIVTDDATLGGQPARRAADA